MNFLPSLAQNGVLGIILSIAFMAIYFLYKENKTLQEKRVEDAKQIASTITEPLQEINRTLKTYNVNMDTVVELLKNINGKKA